jgi:hypothetical protein
MRYLLVVGFACKVYKKEPQARIFVGNKLIDEFYISQHDDTLETTYQELQKQVILQPYNPNSYESLEIKFFPPLKFYEIDIDPVINKLELRIEIKNQDSDYNNGFMSRSTLIQLRVCHFFPLNQKLLSRLKVIRDKNRCRQNYAWYRRHNNTFFNLTINGMGWYGANLKTVKSNSAMFCFTKVGGDGVFTVELYKKYKIFINKIKKSYRYKLQDIFINYFFDKYEQHANQRNTD